MDHFLIEHMED